MDEGAVAYRLDVKRLDSFFDHLCCAIYFDRFDTQFDERTHSVAHRYLSLTSSDPEELRSLALLAEGLRLFYDGFGALVETYEADRIDEIVYANKIIDPVGRDASITIAHTFYGVFDVVSFLTLRVRTGAAA